MMLLQKPQPAHRRQSSTPVVFVQPTHIPGLLSLSKPPKSTPPRNQQRKNAVKQPQEPSPSPYVVRAHAALTPAPQLYTAPVTPPRGRFQEKRTKDKILSGKRSPSPQSRHESPLNKTRTSPPNSPTTTTSHKKKSSQAEVLVNYSNADPFISLTPSPQQKQPLSKAIPVPRSSTRPKPMLARSEPTTVRLPRYQQHRPPFVSKGASMTADFPVCDDMNEIANDDNYLPVSRRLYEGSPFLSTPMVYDTFSTTSPKKKGNGGTKHRRTPSDGVVFHMSSDDEVSSGSGGIVLDNKINFPGVLTLPQSKDNMKTPSKSVSSARSSVDETTKNMSTSLGRDTFFASSLFQNSPSPEELPDPLLF